MPAGSEDNPFISGRGKTSQPQSNRNSQRNSNTGTPERSSDDRSTHSGRHQRPRPLSEIPEKEDIENLDSVFNDRQDEFNQRHGTPSDAGSLQSQERGEGEQELDLDSASIYTYETETFGDTSSIYTSESNPRRLRSGERPRPRRTTTTLEQRPFMDPTVSFSKKAEEQQALYHRNLQRDIAQKEYNSRRQSAQNSPTVERTLRHVHSYGFQEETGDNTGSPLRGLPRLSFGSRNSTPSKQGARSHQSIDGLRSAARRSTPSTPSKELPHSPLGFHQKRLSGSFSQDPFSPESPGSRELSSLQRALKEMMEEKKRLQAELDAEKERNRETEKELEGKVDALENSLQEAEQRAIQAESNDQMQKEAGKSVVESAEKAITQYQQANSDLSEALELVKAQVDILAVEKEKFEEELRLERAEKEKLNQIAEMATAAVQDGGKYAKAMKQLLEDVGVMNQLISETDMKNPALFKDICELGRTVPDEAAELRIGIIEIMVKFGTKLNALAEEKETAEEEHKQEVNDLVEQVEKHRDLAQRLASQVSAEANVEDSQEKDDWEQLYHDKDAAYQKLSDEHERLRQITIKYNGPELKSQIKVLEERLVGLSDRYNALAAERNHFRDAAANWENEYRAQHEQYQENMQERDSMIEQHEQEMRETIKQYYDHLPKNDPEWFQIDALQKQVRKLERLLAHKEGEVLRWQKERDIAVERFHDVRSAMEQGRYIRYAGLFADSTPRSGPRVPRYQSEEETRERARRLEELRRRQKARRVAELEEDDRVEEIRKDRFKEVGTKYPPARPGWKDLVKKSPDERWTGEL